MLPNAIIKPQPQNVNMISLENGTAITAVQPKVVILEMPT